MTLRHMPTAEHEACHVVVGVAAGLRLRRAVLEQQPGWEWSGWVWFSGNPSGAHREALALMYAAGVVWEKGGYYSREDRALLRSVCSGPHAERAIIRASRAMLETLADTHAKVARALQQRDLTGADIAALARGERLELT